ncbi:MAG TPA: TetR/AcrR family transcriptional regulator [Pseudonocardia sp.]|jgi:AcrR family transcriptional regulator
MARPSPTASEAAGAGRRVRLDADARRDQILDAARRLFAERPYPDVSIAELADAAGTTRTNLHYYFGTKRALYLEVLRLFGQLPGPPTPSRARPDADHGIDRLFARWLDVLEENPQQILTMIRAVGLHADHEVEALFRQSLLAWEDRLIAVLELRDEPATRARIRCFQGLVSTAIVEWLDRGALTKAEVHDLLNTTLLAISRGLPAAGRVY